MGKRARKPDTMASVFKLGIEPAKLLWLDSPKLELNDPSTYRKSVSELKRFLKAVENHISQAEQRSSDDLKKLLANSATEDKFFMEVAKEDRPSYVEPSVILLAVSFCLKHGKRVPEEIANVFTTIVEGFYLGGATRSLDGYFKLVPKQKLHLSALRKARFLGVAVHMAIQKLRETESKQAIDTEAFKIVGGRLAISASTARDYYYQFCHRSDAIEALTRKRRSER